MCEGRRRARLRRVKKQLPAWVAGQFERLGTRADTAACRLLVDLVGDDVLALETEVEKLAAWAGGGAVEAADVERLVVPLAETPGYQLTDAWARRDVAGALRASDAMLERAGSRSGELPRLAGMLSSHVARVRECQLLAAEGCAHETPPAG